MSNICTICDFPCLSARTLKRHLDFVHKNVCDICHRTLHDKSKLRIHVNTVHGGVAEKKYSYKKKSRQKRQIPHKERDTNEKFKCDFCTKLFSTKQNLMIHKCRNQKCNFCMKYFTSSNLQTHIKRNHEEQKCDSCGKSFKYAGDLKKHIKTIHEGLRNYKCDSCGKFSTTSGNLKKHIFTHEGQRNHKCDSCGKSFTQSGSLKMHIKTIH